MIRKIFLIAALGATAAAGAASHPDGAQLRGAALTPRSQAAELTLDFAGSPGDRVFTLAHPDRIVIDLAHTSLKPGVHPPAASGVVTAVRFGTQPYGTLRVVLQLVSPVGVQRNWTTSASGPRLVLRLGEPRPGAHGPALAATPAPAPAMPAASVAPPAPAPAAATVSQPPPAATPAATAPAAAAPPPRIVRTPHAPGESERDIVVAVDAGHGGVDPGAIGHGGTREKDVTLAIARALANRINNEPGMRAVLTRDADVFIELRDRAARARAAHADLFVSVHADSIADRNVTGASVYVLSEHGASSVAARMLAERENAVDLLGGVALDDKGALAPVLLDATQSEIIAQSADAAERVVGSLEGVGEIRKAQVQRAGFMVLKSPAMPSLLIETAYISNPGEESRLRNSAQQQRLAEAIAGGLHAYFLRNPPDGTHLKEQLRRTALASASGASPSP